jgi:hypothetical protein
VHRSLFSPLAHSVAEFGNLSHVQTNGSIANQLTVVGSLSIGAGGFYSVPEPSRSLPPTRLRQFCTRLPRRTWKSLVGLTVGGVNVCLSSGINCPSTSGDSWTFSATNGGFIYPATSTNDVVLGATASATAPFYFDAQTVTSSLQIGRNANANLLVGTSTYGGGLNSAFTVNGNDLFTQGMIGSIEGIYSATGVQVGTGTTVYGDGNLYKTNNGDFRMALNVASSSWRFYTAGTERLTFASSGNIGIGVSNPSEALDVVGSIENIISPGSSLTQVSTTTFNNGANSHGVFVAASYAYVANYANHTLGIVDISNSTSPRQIATTTFANGSGPTAVFVSGRYAYVTNLDNDTMATVDISNPASPVQIATTTFASGADPISVYVAGKYAYVTAFSSTANDALVTVDISNPISPVIVNTLAFANSVDPISVYVSGRYAYVANEENDTMSILDLVNPAAPVQVATTTFNAGTDPYEVVVSGRYAYVALYGSKALAVVDILNPTAPVQVATTTVAGGPDSIAVSGRYVYTSNFDNDTMTAIDISVPSAPVVVATSTLVSTANPRRITVFGQNVFMVSRGNATLSIFKIPGIETSSLLAHSAELGSLSVRTSASIANQLTVGGSLNIGSGGFYSAGAFAISSTNTTSTILFSVSTTNAEVSNRLTVGGVSVCLANGTNCSSSSGDSSWTFSAANGGFIYPATSTNDVVLGATASATAPFYFDAQTVTSSLQIGRNGNANLLVGTTTYGGGLNSAFTVNGNDLFTQGMIGSIEGIYSATGVQVGTGTTVYGDGNLYKTNNGDFRMALNVASSSWRFYTAGNERLTVASSGNIGIGTANPTEALDVVGNVENVISSSAPPVQVATTTFASGVGPVTAKVSGNYAYVVNYGNDTMATVDITNPLRPVQVATTTFAGGSNPFDVFVTGKYAYVTLHDDPSMVVIDISNPTAPVQVGVIEWGDQFESAHPTEVYVEGRYAYVAHFFNPAFAVVDISNPVAPVQVATTTFTSSARPRSLEIQGRYAYVANNNNDTMNIVDIANPLRPVTVATTTYSAGAGVQGVSVQGRYAYVSLYTTGQFSVVDISNPNSPRGVATTTFNSGSQPANVSVSGRYAYVALIGGNAVATVDVSNPLAPVQVATTTFPTSSNLRDVTVSGQHLYVAAFGANLIATLRIPGVETSSLLAGSAELGSLNVRNNVSIANQLTVGGSLNIGMGGFYSAGAFAISSTNTTSTILFSVSTTNAEISNRLTVGGVRVCLENGANCPASSPSEFNWTYSQASGFIRPTTSTNDVVLGASASATAPFYFDAQTVTSSLQIGRNGNSNLFVGTSTYSDGLNSAFSVNGNDIFVQGMIGSIEGIYSATGVQVGTGTAVYGDGNLYKTNNGDFTFALNDSGSSYRLYTSSTERFTIASNGNVGIGVSNPTEELEVAGMIDNSATVSSSLTFVRTVPVGTTPITMLVQGDFGYAISQDDRFRVFDLSEPSNPRQIASIASAADPSEIAIQGRYAYITGNTADNIQVIDISNPGAPAVMSSLSIGNDPRGIGAYGKYLYVLNYVADQVQIVDVSLPTAPRIVRTLSMDGPRFIRFSGKYAYVSLNVPGTVNILDVSNPEAAYLVGSVTSLGTNLGDIMLAGRYAYVSSLDNSRLNVLDISNPTAPTLVKSVTTTAPYHMHLQGRYLYTSNYDAATISMFDVASATNPILVDQATTAAGSRDLTSKGQYLYVITEAGNMYVFDTGGTQLTSAVAAAANLGGVRVRTEMSLANQLRVEASMSVGPGGIHTLGALAVNSTNTTSTFAYAVSSTFMEVSNRLRVNRQSVCLMSGLNCLAAVNTELSIQWSSSTANGTLFLTTTTRDLLVGGSTTATAGFIVDTGGATGSVMFGANSNTSAVVGTSTYRTGLDRFFRLTGNDLFVQGFLGSLGGFFSTTGVRVGAASSTIYTDSLLYSPAQRDFQLSVNDSGSSFRFFTSSTERLTVATSGRVGIGISAPQTELDVNGDVSARMTTSTDLRLVNSFSQPGTPENFVIHGNFVYLVGSSPNRLYVLDITDPANPQSVTTTQIGSAGVDLKVRGNFLYILSSGNIMSYDISNPRSPRFRGSASINLGGAVRFEIYEHYLYIAQDNGALNVYNIQFPDVPVFVGTQTAWSSNGLAVKGRYLFSATSFDNTFKVFDLSNPERPTQIATTTDVGTQPRDMIVMGNYAYVTALTSNILTTVDISNPWAPRAVASTTIATQNSRNHLYGSGNLIYIASNSGLTVVDVSNPTAPRRKVNMTLTNPRRVVASGRYVYTAQSANLFHTYEIQGLETNALVAATAQFGEFSVLGNGELVPNLSADGITMGVGGAFIQGELSVGSATSVLGDILPGIPGASDLGSPTLSWRNITASGTLMAASAELSSLLVTPSSTSISVLSSTSSDVGNLAAVIQGKYLYSVKDGSGSADSLQIWDVSDSRNLRLLSEFGISQFGGSLPIDLKIKGKYAYVLASNGFTPRMTIVDISNPSQPVTSTSLSIGIGGVELATYGGYVYATMRDTDFSDGFDIVDVRNPARPQRKSVAVNPTGLAQVEIHDGYMLALGGSVNTRDLFIYSLADPENPVLASSTRFATSAVQDIDVQGRYAYIGANGSSNVSWRVVDWTDPSVPVVATSVKMSLDPSITEVKVAGEYLYLGGSGGQIFVYDISDPYNPVQVASHQMASLNQVREIEVQGGVMYILQSQSASGGSISIATLGLTELATIDAASAELGSLSVLTNASVQGQFTVSGDLSVGSGGILSQGLLGVFTSSTFATTTVISNSASNTNAVLEVLGGCDNGNVTGTSRLVSVGNMTDTRKFMVTCGGNVYADGTFSSPATDFAEYFSSDGSLTVGDVLVLDPNGTPSNPSVLKSSSSASSRARTLGVFSTKPSFVGGYTEGIESGASSTHVPVALLGRVPTKASAINGAILPGDQLMVSSNGTAVKAKGPGMILGIAIEALPSGTDTIEVFVDPTYWGGDLLNNDIVIASSTEASASLFTVNSPSLSLQGSAWNGSSANTISFSLTTQVLSTTSSNFVLSNTSGTSLLTISNLGNTNISGDLTVGRKLYLGSKTNQAGSASTYIFVDDTLSPTSTYIATNADGWSTSSTFDYAERFPSPENLIPGELVMADQNNTENVIKTNNQNNIVLGIVSTKPGFVTGAPNPGTYPIALAGRVPTKIIGQINIGDEVRASNIPGIAEKAEGPGPIIGIALQAHTSPEQGTIIVFVKPGWSLGNVSSLNSNTTNNSYSTTNISSEGSTKRGLAKIYVGSTEVQVTFASIQAYPVVQARPLNRPNAGYWITNVSDTGFKITLDQPAQTDVTFTWSVDPSPVGAEMWFSDETNAVYDPLTGQVVGPTPQPPEETASSTGDVSP